MCIQGGADSYIPAENQRDLRGHIQVLVQSIGLFSGIPSIPYTVCDSSGVPSFTRFYYRHVLPIRYYPRLSPLIIMPSSLKLGLVHVSAIGDVTLKTVVAGGINASSTAPNTVWCISVLVFMV